MKLKYENLVPGDKPIASVEDYLAVRERFAELALQLRTLQLEMKKHRDQGREPPRKLFDQFDILESQDRQVHRDFIRRKPYVLISRCPYCGMAIWAKVGVFSLVDEFWYREDSDGRDDVAERFRCRHLFCLDGGLNLNGYQPTEAHAPITVTNDTIPMAAEVPFVKPRVLTLPTMLAVVHSFPVADKYTAYPIIYFAEVQPPQQEFCIGWARQEYVDHYRPTGQGVVMIGRRTDAQDYELDKWVRQGKLFWLDPGDEEHPLVRGPAEAFPYRNIAGRRHPYLIKEGRVQDLSDPPHDSKPEIRLER